MSHNEHTIAKHGDYVRRVHRDAVIVVQYLDQERAQWRDYRTFDDTLYDESRVIAKKLQTSQEKHITAAEDVAARTLARAKHFGETT